MTAAPQDEYYAEASRFTPQDPATAPPRAVSGARANPHGSGKAAPVSPVSGAATSTSSSLPAVPEQTLTAPVPDPDSTGGSLTAAAGYLADGVRDRRETPAADWGVFINECGIFAQCGGADWWVLFSMHQPSGRMTCLDMSIAGGEWHVMCDSKEDAQWLADEMAANGIHPHNAKVARLPACVARVAKRRAESEAKDAALDAFRQEWIISPDYRAHVELANEQPAGWDERHAAYDAMGGYSGWITEVQRRAELIRNAEAA